MSIGLPELPADVVPAHYKITLQTTLEKHSFAGHEDIGVKVVKETKSIVIHSVDITIEEVVYTPASKQGVKPTDISYQKENETVTFTFEHALEVGTGSLFIKFTGKIYYDDENNQRGIYQTRNGKGGLAVVTQFQAIDARRGFPCWDEPAHKATFALSLIVAENLTAVSNTPIEAVAKVEEGFKMVTFCPTQIMSSYLVAFAIGEYDFIEGKSTDGVLIRVYTPLGQTNLGKFALEVTLKSFPFFSNYFGIPFALPKCDVVSVTDFAAGGMENYGLITCIEREILIDSDNPKTSTSFQIAALLVAHEVAHMWFGDYMTTKTWPNLWMNEGFAEYLSYLCIDHCYPSWNIWSVFLTKNTNVSLNNDALTSTHPVENYNLSDMDSIFDTIVYAKGSSLLKMLKTLIGEEIFKKGLTLLLETHKFQSVVIDDLWRAFDKLGKPLKPLMDHWIKQSGFPLLEITEIPPTDISCNINKRKYKISQHRFFSKSPDTTDETLWWIPVRIVTPVDDKLEVVYDDILKDKHSEIEITANEWIKVNPNQTDFYRVKYSAELLANLKAPLSHAKLLSVNDRIGVTSDVIAFNESRIMDTVAAFQYCESFLLEKSYGVWDRLEYFLNTSIDNTNLDTIFSAQSFYPNYENFRRKLFSKIFKATGWQAKQGEDALAAPLRAKIIGILANGGDHAVIQECHRLFAEYLKDNNSLPVYLRSIVYKMVLAHPVSEVANGKDYKEITKLIPTAGDEEKARYIAALGYAKSLPLVKKTLKNSISKFDKQYCPSIIQACALNVGGREITWEFVKLNWDTFKNFDNGLLSRVVRYATQYFVDEAKAVDVQQFFEKVGYTTGVEAAVAKIRTNAKILTEDRPGVEKFLEKYKPKQKESS